MAQRIYAYGLNKMADVIFNETLTLSARTSMPGDDGTGGEIAGNGYNDIQKAADKFGNAGAGALADGVVRALEDADFGAAAGGNWGRITHIMVKAGANLVGWVTLTNPRTINDGDSFVVPAAEIEFSVTSRA